MSDYTQVTDFSAKDTKTTGDPEKIIYGSDIDTELDAISTAIATKYDSNDIASQIQAEALTSNSVLLTPLRLANVLNDNGGMLGDIQALADPNADQLLGWDDSAGAVIGFTFGDGLEFSGTTVRLEHLGIGDLEDAGADSLMGWDDSAGATAWFTFNNGLEFSGASTIGIADVAAGANNPVNISSGTITFDIDALADVEGSALAATAKFVVDDAGTAKAVAVQDMGMRIQTGQTTQNLAANDMNSIMKFTGTATLTIQLNATTDIPLGVPVVLIMDHATQELTVQADTSVTLESVWHPGGTANASDVVKAGGMAVLVQTETDVWQLSGDITDS